MKRVGSLLAVTTFAAGLLGMAVTVAPAASSATRLYPMCNGSLSVSMSGDYTLTSMPYLEGSETCSLKYGDSGNGVSALQRTLNKCHSAGLVVDGKFGAATQTAVIASQKAIGVDPDGVYGPATATRSVKIAVRTSTGQFIGCRLS
jgi:peptidoglycan hydrolase-like protein with peptidoglycan-binding domain